LRRVTGNLGPSTLAARSDPVRLEKIKKKWRRSAGSEGVPAIPCSRCRTTQLPCDCGQF